MKIKSQLLEYRSPSAFILALLAGILWAASGLRADVLVINPTADTLVIDQGSATATTYENFGAAVRLGGSIYSATTGEYSLLRFNLAGTLPGGATITAATLKLTEEFSYAYSNNEVLRVWQVNGDNDGWVETGTNNRSGATAAYLDQTAYTDPSTNAGTDWASGGIFADLPGDLGAELGSLSLTPGSVPDQTISISLNVAAVTSWLTDSALQDAGLAFHMTNDEVAPPSSRFFYVYSMESGEPAAFLPQLEITYSPIPEASALALLGLSACVLLGRRRLRHASV